MARPAKGKVRGAAGSPPKRAFRPLAVSAEEELASLLNLGPKSAQWLVEAGIRSREEVERLGAVEVCRRVRANGRPVSVLLAYAIEGALMGCAWSAIPFAFKQQLRADFAALRAAEKHSR